ncbi:hypothetical protein IKU74_07160 [bacterium]|nr:hypothetical protein [bacterium]
MKNLLSKKCLGALVPDGTDVRKAWSAFGQTWKKMFNTELSAFTMSEVLITLGILGALAILLVPILKKAQPDETDALHKKATFVVERVVHELASDEFLYPRTKTFNGLANTDAVTLNGETHSGDTKFCTLFISRLNIKPGTEPNCTAGQVNAVTNEGVEWYLPINNFQGGAQTLMVDVNGPEEPNVIGEDRFEYIIQPGSAVAEEEENTVVAATTEAPPTLVQEKTVDENAIPDANDDRAPMTEYTISVSPMPSQGLQTLVGAGGGKVNGQYVLMAVPKPGYKCSWFTKQVTVKDANVTVDDLTCTENTEKPVEKAAQDVTHPGGGGDDDDDKTYCIAANISGVADKCIVEGTGCDKAPGNYTVTMESVDDTMYQPSWTSKTIQIVDSDVTVTGDCKKEAKAECGAIVDNRPAAAKLNCPVTLPPGNCPVAGSEDKYLVGSSYEVTVTPVAGAYLNGESGQQKVEVSVGSTAGVSLTENLIGKCDDSPNSFLIEVTTTKNATSGGVTTGTVKVSSSSDLPDGISISASVGATYKTCFKENGDVGTKASALGRLNKTVGLGSSANVTLKKEAVTGVTCGTEADRFDEVVDNGTESWVITIDGTDYPIGEETSIQIGEKMYNVMNTMLPAMDFDCACKNSAKGTVKVTLNLAGTEYVSNVSAKYLVSGSPSDDESGTLSAAQGGSQSAEHKMMPGSYNISASNIVISGQDDKCGLKLTGPTPSSVNVVAGKTSNVTLDFACTKDPEKTLELLIKHGNGVHSATGNYTLKVGGNSVGSGSFSIATLSDYSTIIKVPGETKISDIAQLSVTGLNINGTNVGSLSQSTSLFEGLGTDFMAQFTIDESALPDPCASSNRYTLTVTETYDSYSNSPIYMSAGWGNGSGPWYISPYSSMGGGYYQTTVNGGTTASFTFNDPAYEKSGYYSNGSDYIPSNVSLKGIVKSVTVDGSPVGGSWSGQICKNTTVNINYSLEERGTSSICEIMFKNSTASGCSTSSSVSTTINVTGGKSASTYFAPGQTPVLQVPCSQSYNYSASKDGYDITFSPTSTSFMSTSARNTVNVCMKPKAQECKITFQNGMVGNNECDVVDIDGTITYTSDTTSKSTTFNPRSLGGATVTVPCGKTYSLSGSVNNNSNNDYQMVLGATSASFGTTSSTKTVNVCYALGARSDGKIRFTTDIDYTNCGSSTVFDIIGINVIATGGGTYNMDLTGNPGVSGEMTVAAGSYTFSYSGFNPTISMGCGCGYGCTTCYDDITKVTFSPSSVTVPQGGTKDVKITYGCNGSSVKDTIELKVGSLSAKYGGGDVTGTTPTVSASGNTVTVTAAQDVTISGFSVVPSNYTKAWQIIAEGDTMFPSPSSGTGTKAVSVEVSKYHTTGGCFYARYTDGSATSSKVCITKSDSGSGGGTGTILLSCQGEGDYVAAQCDYDLYNHDTGDQFKGTWYADDGDIYIDDAPIGTYTVTSPHGGRVCDRSGSCGIRVTATTPKPAQFTLTTNKVQSVTIILNYDTWELDD